MAKSIGALKEGILEKVGVLDIQIVKKISNDSYIVGDEKDHIVLVSDQSLQVGSAYRLIKPSFSEMKIRKNPKFGVVKIEKKITVKPLKKKDEDSMCSSITNDEKGSNDNIRNDFALVDSLGVGAIVQDIKLLVVRKSAIIQGKFGNFRIVACKDIQNQKNDVNLYRNLVEMVEVGVIYTFTKLKVCNLKKDDDDFHRLATTSNTRISKASLDDQKEFEERKVRIGDFIVKGTIIGISELNIYQSCSVCRCKVDDEDFCRKCNKKVGNKREGFHLVMYIQPDNQEEEVAEIFSFNSILDLKIENPEEITEENLNKMMMDMKCEAEYEVDRFKDDGTFKLVKFQMLLS